MFESGERNSDGEIERLVIEGVSAEEAQRLTSLAEDVEPSGAVNTNEAVQEKERREQTRRWVQSVEMALSDFRLKPAQAIESNKIKAVAKQASLDEERTTRILLALVAEKNAQEAERLREVLEGLKESLVQEENGRRGGEDSAEQADRQAA